MPKTPCPRGCGNEARTSSLYGVLPCYSCIGSDRKDRKTAKAPEFITQTQQTRIQGQRDRHEGDIMLPFDHNGKPNEEFRRLYPDKAQQLFGELDRVTNANIE